MIILPNFSSLVEQSNFPRRIPWKIDIHPFSFRRENRFDILVYESMFLGFVIGYLSLYYYIPCILIVFLLIHLIGTIYSERNSGKIKEIFKLFYERFIRRTPTKASEKPKSIPKVYRYNYHLKPSNDIRLQQVTMSLSDSLFS